MSVETFKSSQNIKQDDYLAKLKFEQAGTVQFNIDPNLSAKITVTFKTPYCESPLIHYNLIVDGGSFDVSHVLFDVSPTNFILCVQNSNLYESVKGTVRWHSRGSGNL